MKTNILSKRFLTFIAFLLAIVSAVLLCSVVPKQTAKADDSSIPVLSEAEAMEKLYVPEVGENLKGKYAIVGVGAILSMNQCAVVATADEVFFGCAGDSSLDFQVISYNNETYFYCQILSNSVQDSNYVFSFIDGIAYVSDTSLLFDNYVLPVSDVTSSNTTSNFSTTSNVSNNMDLVLVGSFFLIVSMCAIATVIERLKSRLH